MVWIEKHKRSDKVVSAYVVWRLGGGRDGEKQFEAFSAGTSEQNLARAEGFQKMVVAAGSRWPDGWIKGEGFVRPHGGDTTISRDLVSTVTEKVTKQMQEWQSRPLDPVYPVVLIDALFLKVRDGSVGDGPVYVAMGVNLEGIRDVLGMWIGPTGGEGSKQWATMLSDLKNRGVQDVCIVCCDGLKGLPDSIRAIWPEGTVQTCVVHLVRNSLRLSSRKDWQKVTTGLRRIYTAPTVTAAEAEFADFTEHREERYPAMINTWRNAWDEFAPFLEFPPEVRKLIYTTNAIESLNADSESRPNDVDTSPTNSPP